MTKAEKKENNTEDMRKVSPEEVLREGQAIRIRPQGYSMMPFLDPEKDEVIIEPCPSWDHAAEQLKRGDVILYRRIDGILVLHRIVRIKGEEIMLAGDNMDMEDPKISVIQVCGILTARVRKGRELSVRNVLWRLASAVWLFLSPMRPFLHRIWRSMRRR
ncbi:MAG: S24/S26 family peptidase [Eubacterium sp.]|nr:S24/S26 family peptidase [Eubacterium sp.]